MQRRPWAAGRGRQLQRGAGLKRGPEFATCYVISHMLQGQFTTTPSRVLPSTQLPRDVAAPHDAHDLATDLILDYWSQRNQTEAEPVFNHREPSACELQGTEQFAADSLALLNGMEDYPPFCRKLPTDALNFLTAQGVEEVGSRPEFAGGGPPALTPPDELVFALRECISELSTNNNSAASNRVAISVIMPVQPSCRSSSPGSDRRPRAVDQLHPSRPQHAHRSTETGARANQHSRSLGLT